MRKTFSQKVCVLGLGYIGLPTASILATKGFRVHGTDVNPHTVETISRGDIHIHEPDLDVLVQAGVQSGRLTASIEPDAADVFILAVPTPLLDGHVPDISYVEQATRAVAPYLAGGNLVILESTSPVGTTERVGAWLSDLRPDLHIASRDDAEALTSDDARVYVAHCPERVLPGQILRELVENDRVVGGVDCASAEEAFRFYRSFVNGQVFITDSRTAEMCKLAENAFRDVNIAFANELSLICDRLGIDVWELLPLANRHPRVNILKPGPGVGGHCIAVDPWFIVDSAPELARLIRTAREVNDGKPEHVIGKIKAQAGDIVSPVIACLGLAFKAEVDDLRESPAVRIVSRLAEEVKCRILAVEPHVTTLPKQLAGRGIELVDLKTALEEANLLVVLVDHRAFTEVDGTLLNGKTVVDTRGIWRQRSATC